MSKIYEDLVVDIPSDAKVSYSNNRVYVILKKQYDPKKGYNIDKRLVIGKYIDQKTMHPNDNFKCKYQAEWDRLTHKPSLLGCKKLGSYASVYSIANNNGILRDLIACFDPQKANAILDYATFMIWGNSDASEQFESFMKDKVLFSDKVLSDSWFSSFFKEGLPEDKIIQFKNSWAKHCKDTGIEDVYLCIDGSNNDCSSKESEYAEKGKAKSKNNTNLISYMYAVSATDGTPITYSEYRGGEVDSKGIKEVINYLISFGIKVKGAIIDKGFCKKNVLEFLKSNNIEYVVLLPKGVKGKNLMMKKYAEQIRWRVSNFIRKTDYFAVTDRFPIFESSKENSFIHLFFDWRNGGGRAIDLISKTYDAYDQVVKSLEEDKKVQIPPKYKDYIKLIINEKGTKVEIDEEALQKEIDSKGYSAIASSEEMTAEEANTKYKQRQNSEICYKFIKSHLGFRVLRVQRDSSIKAKFFECFIASIIRNEIFKIAKKLDISTNVALRELSLLEIRLFPGDMYSYIHNENVRQEKLLRALGINIQDLDSMTEEENNRNHGIKSRRRKRKTGPKKGTHRKQYDEDGNIIKRKPGPKPGSHHKKVSLKKDGTPKKKPGPKPGSHNRKENLLNNISN